METIKHHKIFATHISVYFVDGICVAAAAIVCGSFFFACAVIEMFSLQILSEAYIIHVHIFTAYAYVNMRHSFTLRKFPTKSFIHKQLLPRISEARVTKFTECDCEYWKITCHHLAESYALCSLSRVCMWKWNLCAPYVPIYILYVPHARREIERVRDARIE